MRHIRSCAWVLVGVVWAGLVAGCTGSDADRDAEPSAAPQASEQASASLRDVLGQVDWPDDEGGVTALLGTPIDSENLAWGLYEFNESTVSAGPTTGAWDDNNRAGVLLLRSAVTALGPNNCVDAKYSPVFADYFALGDGVPSGRDEPLWNALMGEVERVASSPAPEGLLWVQCTQVFDDYTGTGMLREGQRRYYVAWSDGEWVYSLVEDSGAARDEVVRALVQAAQAKSAPATADPDTVQLMYISDSSGFEAAEVYVALAEEELGVPVELIDWRRGGLSMIGALNMIEKMPQVVAEAEIVVLWGNPTGSGVKTGHETCVESEAYSDPGAYTVADWAPFADVTRQTLDAIWAAREGQPTVLRVTDIYAPGVAAWEEHGIRDACMTTFETMSDALRTAAEEHGAMFVSALDAYNGSDHTRDPVAAGLIDPDGQHPGEAGGQALAETLAAAGFEPTPAP